MRAWSDSGGEVSVRDAGLTAGDVLLNIEPGKLADFIASSLTTIATPVTLNGATRFFTIDPVLAFLALGSVVLAVTGADINADQVRKLEESGGKGFASLRQGTRQHEHRIDASHLGKDWNWIRSPCG